MKKNKLNRTDEISKKINQLFRFEKVAWARTEEERLWIRKEKEILIIDELIGEIKAKLQEWIADHNGEINVIEFSKVNKVPEAKIEQVLNRLVAEGYLSVVQ